ncbi:hypothetical protein V8C44DRAFT_316479 [Trichoderma aethiopicum]
MYYNTCYNSAKLSGRRCGGKRRDTRRQSVLPVTICMAFLKLFASFHLPILFLLLTSFYLRGMLDIERLWISLWDLSSPAAVLLPTTYYLLLPTQRVPFYKLNQHYLE